MSILHDAYTALLAGLTTKTGNEIHWEDEYGYPITIEPIDVETEKYILRYYHDNGQKSWEINLQNNKRCGKTTRWDRSGKKWWEYEYGSESHWRYNSQQH